MGSKRSLILGYDAVSSLGIDLDVQWQRAVGGDCGIGELTRFPLSPNFPVRVAGEVAEIDSRRILFYSRVIWRTGHRLSSNMLYWLCIGRFKEAGLK